MFPQLNTTTTTTYKESKAKLWWRKWARSGKSQHCPELHMFTVKKHSLLQGFFVRCRATCREFVGVFFLSGSEDQLRSEEISSSDLTLRRFIVCSSSLQTIRTERMNRRIYWKVRPNTWLLCLSLCHAWVVLESFFGEPHWFKNNNESQQML